jgi:hypothetical protein
MGWGMLANFETDARIAASVEHQMTRWLGSPLMQRWMAINAQSLAAAEAATATTSVVGGMAGVGAIAAGAIPVVTMAGVFVALGAGYYEARQIAHNNGALSGFSHGFTAGVLKWEWGHVTIHFLKRNAGTNAFDQATAVAGANGYNKGLVAGFAAGSGLPENTRKAYRIQLRKLAGITSDGAWSKNPNEARLQQRNYVIELASAGLKHGVIKGE